MGNSHSTSHRMPQRFNCPAMEIKIEDPLLKNKSVSNGLDGLDEILCVGDFEGFKNGIMDVIGLSKKSGNYHIDAGKMGRVLKVNMNVELSEIEDVLKWRCEDFKSIDQ